MTKSSASRVVWVSITMQQCCDLSKQIAGVGGYVQQYDPQRGWNCSCKSFRYRKSCKHLRQLEDELCGWHEQYGEAQAEDGVCPECGGPTETVGV